jgi:hypothetical protein
METTLAVPNSVSPSAVPFKGRAIAALVCGFFGSGWMFGAVLYGEISNPVLLTVIALLGVTFFVWPIIRLYSVRHLPYSAGGGRTWSAVSKPYWTLVTIEWLACIVASNWLSRAGRYDLIPQLVGLIVGVHFAPLAKIFRAPIYYWTGAAMVSGVLVSLAIPTGDVRNIVASGVCGLALWVTEAVILCKDRFAL